MKKKIRKIRNTGEIQDFRYVIKCKRLREFYLSHSVFDKRFREKTTSNQERDSQEDYNLQIIADYRARISHSGA